MSLCNSRQIDALNFADPSSVKKAVTDRQSRGFMPHGLKLAVYLVCAGSLGVILAAMLDPFGWGVNLFFSITAACLVVIVGLRLFR